MNVKWVILMLLLTSVCFAGDAEESLVFLVWMDFHTENLFCVCWLSCGLCLMCCQGEADKPHVQK